jgi:hypothetical protein
MSTASSAGKVLPAQLAFLTIYNPAFVDSDETEYEQIFFHYSSDQSVRKHEDRPDAHNKGSTKADEDVKNEQLRQVGLARGMVDFAKYVRSALASQISPLTSSAAISPMAPLSVQSRPRSPGLSYTR